VVACYTDDLVYSDPNTRGNVEGADAMRRYLTRLFERWEMRWAVKKTFALAGIDGSAVLWHATLRPRGAEEGVEADGMDLVLVEGGKVKRNEVYFDRAVLAPLLEAATAPSSD
jgi:ketosteroid isomerase-like protein